MPKKIWVYSRISGLASLVLVAYAQQVFKSFDHVDQTHIKGDANLPKFQEINSPFPYFILTDHRLRNLESFGQINLPQTRFNADFL